MVGYARGALGVLRRWEEKTPGRNLCIRGRRRGRQEQMMPTLTSIEDQVAAAGLS
jgi:hypothetical protein